MLLMLIPEVSSGAWEAIYNTEPHLRRSIYSRPPVLVIAEVIEIVSTRYPGYVHAHCIELAPA